MAKILGRGSAYFSRSIQKNRKIEILRFLFYFYMHKAKKSFFFQFCKNYKSWKSVIFTLKTPQTLVQFVVLMEYSRFKADLIRSWDLKLFINNL